MKRRSDDDDEPKYGDERALHFILLPLLPTFSYFPCRYRFKFSVYPISDILGVYVCPMCMCVCVCVFELSIPFLISLIFSSYGRF